MKEPIEQKSDPEINIDISALLTYPKIENKQQPTKKTIKSWVIHNTEVLKKLKDKKDLLEKISHSEFNPIAVIFLAIIQFNILSKQKKQYQSNPQSYQETLKKTEHKIKILQEQFLKLFNQQGMHEQCIHYVEALRESGILSEETCKPLIDVLTLAPNSNKLSGLFGHLPRGVIEKIFNGSSRIDIKNAFSLAGFWKMEQGLNQSLSKTKPEIFLFDQFIFFLISGKVYAWGQNDQGQLGLGDTRNREIPELIRTLEAEYIVRIFKNPTYHSIFFLTRSGQVYTCGDNKEDSLCLGDTKNRKTPTLIKDLDQFQITNIQCNHTSTYFITQSGRVHVFLGSEIKKILNLPSEKTCKKQLASNKLIPIENEYIIYIAQLHSKSYLLTQSGRLFLGDSLSPNEYHTYSEQHEMDNTNPPIFTKIIHTQRYGYILTQSGQVYAYGHNSAGDLGLGHTNDTPIPELIKTLENKRIIKIITKHSSSFFIAETGQVYACGQNEDSQLGVGNNHHYKTPKQLDALIQEHIINIEISLDATYFLTKSGQVYACGSNRHGQLGLGDTKIQNIPTSIYAFKNDPVIQIESNPSGEASYFLTQSGQVYVCGNNEHGQLGLGDTENRNTPTLIHTLKHEHVLQIKSQRNSVYFLTQSNQVYACGDNAHGQLGLGESSKKILSPQKIDFSNPINQNNLKQDQESNKLNL